MNKQPINTYACFGNYYAQKTVLITGHTGFKGAWLAHWLLALGARVVGLALPCATKPALFKSLRLEQRIQHHLQDIRDYSNTRNLILQANPDMVFHMAAQPLVRVSYKDPISTYATNVMGTVHVLNALRELVKPCAVICVTTDKCYENREWQYGYRECDALGGYDPYSSSKACAEIIAHAYKQSFFNPDHATQSIAIATARAGNVIGGGDWAYERLLPDCIRALMANTPIYVRNPNAIRPWQHVLEPLSGYLCLGAALGNALAKRHYEELKILSGPFNFGPLSDQKHTVAQFVEAVLRIWPGQWHIKEAQATLHEASLLHLAIDKAIDVLGWKPVWDFEKTVCTSINWYRAWNKFPDQASDLTNADLEKYVQDARQQYLAWAS